ncbi:MAG: hypothetical protein BJ554DRAFT_1977 [Olpidium bornovanus]|uniref:Geranylgeranyl transferase type-2 subunit alpha n=1 Tax=Olpidium bornovanus TaxID=278681 RepID=A0A8H7ZR59_9FUNG|nr:MAG: hypothetical protein BJ554DRAFT_1977 [Olpidium bornovanus]
MVSAEAPPGRPHGARATAGRKSRRPPRSRPLAARRRKRRSSSTLPCATSSSRLYGARGTVLCYFSRTGLETGPFFRAKKEVFNDSRTRSKNEAWRDAWDSVDPALTDEALALSAKLASANPEMYTAWNLRRKALLKRTASCSQDEAQALLTAELRMLEDAGRAYPKSYWILNHRRWVLENMPNPDWRHEMKLVAAVLEKDDRNCGSGQRLVLRERGVPGAFARETLRGGTLILTWHPSSGAHSPRVGLPPTHCAEARGRVWDNCPGVYELGAPFHVEEDSGKLQQLLSVALPFQAVGSDRGGRRR